MARNTAQNRKEAIEQWKQWCETVQTRSVVSVRETPAQRGCVKNRRSLFFITC